ncbi:hypothetical protein CISIN_1g045020mg [Citrus sinensis]|uniref:Peptidase A2 domain-containing protein n=1 Tax=Citrus sinensis TaxID=2711 RepID=A0A067DE02_CITSI|nr:hypothetical protein CISIN_1g045020mg [Citrus sinensis]
MGRVETLKYYIRRFRLASAKVENCDDQLAIVTFKRGLPSNHPFFESLSEVSFLPQDLKLIQSPHDDALVISIKIGNCLVKRILIDNGSSVNILDDATVEKMRLEQDKIKLFEQPLIGLSGIVTNSDGVITLLVIAKSYSLLTDFLVVKATSPYNVILGRQWIHKMRAVPSTCHQVLCYQTIYGIEEIRGDQATAWACAVLALKETKRKDSNFENQAKQDVK